MKKRYTTFLVFNEDGLDRARKTRPRTSLGEICFKLEIDLPESIFKKPPIKTFSIEFDEEDFGLPPENITMSLRPSFGIEEDNES